MEYNFTKKEYSDNLSRLNIKDHLDLVGKTVYYVKPSYGEHKVLSWDNKTKEYLLQLDKNKFYSNPFKIKNI
jgi:hypothetical protein